jgi:hypothetical protein
VVRFSVRIKRAARGKTTPVRVRIGERAYTIKVRVRR